MTESRASSARETPQRVLHSLSEFGALSETFIAERMIELERLGWEAWVATRSVANRDLFPFPPAERLISPARPPLARRIAGRIAGRYRSPLHTSWWMGPAIEAARPALVHAHFGWTAAEVLPVVKQAGLPLVAGFHGYDLTVFPVYGIVDFAGDSHAPKRRHHPYRRLLRELDRALVVSSFLERRLRSLGYEGPVDVVPTGIRLGDFQFRGPRREPAGETRLIFVGRHVPYKGLDVLLRALAEVAAGEPELRLDVVGDGPCRSRYESLAAELGLSRLVRFHGALPRPGVVHALQEADLLVAPSRTVATGQAEGLSNVTKEAMAVGLQVVATANGGLPETIPPSHRHELVAEGDPAALAARIAALLRDRESWPARARLAREWVADRFDWARLAPRIASVYDAAQTRAAAGGAGPSPS